ncbi:ACT domain-containing protein [Patescibacteria group bacterium]|nr:ACT domain-containing protein [Patescibacteria group bacterium]
MNKIYYLGPKGSYSHNITKKVFVDTHEIIACDSFSDIVKNTLRDKSALGVLPIENSITSNIHENMDYLFREDLMIISETYLKIRLFLVGFKSATLQDVKKVYSHQKAFLQCRQYVSEHNFVIQQTDSTASARDLILKINDKRVAAIGSEELAENQKLKILAGDIGDEKFNITRFAFVSAMRAEASGNKASIMFTVPHKPGTLAKILMEFSNAEFNLIKIDSRPIPATSWEYQFWVDLENKTNKEIEEKFLSDILKKNVLTYKIIGIYKSGKLYRSSLILQK